MSAYYKPRIQSDRHPALNELDEDTAAVIGEVRKFSVIPRCAGLVAVGSRPRPADLKLGFGRSRFDCRGLNESCGSAGCLAPSSAAIFSSYVWNTRLYLETQIQGRGTQCRLSTRILQPHDLEQLVNMQINRANLRC